MPTYRFKCPFCLVEQDHIRTIKERNDAPTCHRRRMERIIVAPSIFVPGEIRYRSPIDDRPITNKQARIEDLKRSGSRPWEGLTTEKQEAARQAGYAEQKQDAVFEKAVTETFYQMPEAKRRVLSEGV